MLWRACRLSHPVRAFARPLRRPDPPRWLTTDRIVVRAGAPDPSRPASDADDREEADSGLHAPFFSAVDLLKDPEHLPSRVQKEEIKIAGIIRSIRKQKHACFAHISDGSTLAPLQAVLSPELALGWVETITSQDSVHSFDPFLV